MKEYSQQQYVKTRKAVVFPVVSELPDPLEIGETVYRNDPMFPGLYIYLGEMKWVMIMTPKNNVIEEHVATSGQKIFELANSYPTDGQSINVFINGTRINKDEFAELDTNIICIKEDGRVSEGDRIEFQIFNKYEERHHYTRRSFN
jgi:hypothetical protein